MRALVLRRKGSEMTCSMMGLRMAILLCRPSSRAGLLMPSRDWNETVGPGVLGVAGRWLKRTSAGEGKEMVLTLELLRLWTGFRLACFGGRVATGVRSCMDWKGNDVATRSLGLVNGELACESSTRAKVGVSGVPGYESKVGLVGDWTGSILLA